MSASHSQRKKCSLLGDMILTVIFNLPSKTENYSYRYSSIPLLPLTSHQKKRQKVEDFFCCSSIITRIINLSLALLNSFQPIARAQRTAIHKKRVHDNRYKKQAAKKQTF